MTAKRNADGGFTLVEMLVVIIIISILAGFLMPTLTRVRAAAYTVRCANRMRQLASGVQQYMNDYKVHPPWLSTMYPNYIADKRMYICPADTSYPPGSEGRCDDDIPSGLIDQYAELDDTESCEATEPVYVGVGRYDPSCELVGADTLRNPEIRGCSYSYEFACPRCTYWLGADFPDKLGNADGVISWREVKIYAEQEGYIDVHRTVDPDRKFGGRVPLIRCFWHNPKLNYDNMNESRVLNFASGDGNIYWSNAEKDGWKYDWTDF